jgi:hypothetical protein
MSLILLVLMLQTAQPAPASPAAQARNAEAGTPVSYEKVMAAWGLDSKQEGSAAPNGVSGQAAAPRPQDVEAANQAAIARAEAAARDIQDSGTWADDSNRMRCRQTTSGFVCGNSDKAIEEQEAALKARMDSLNKPD